MEVRQLFRGDEEALYAYIDKVGKQWNVFTLNKLQDCGGLQTMEDSLLNPIPTKTGEGQYWGSFDSGELVGLVIHFWHNVVILHCPNEIHLAALLDKVESSGRLVAGFRGASGQADFCMERWGIKDAQWALNCDDMLMSADPANPDLVTLAATATSRGLKAVIASEEHEDVLMEWMACFEVEGMGIEEPDMTEVRERVTKILHTHATSNRPMAWLLLDGTGTPVSLAGIFCRIDGMIQLGPVYTPPAHRAKGYARQLIAHLLLKEHSENWSRQAVLFAGDPYAIRCYESVGFQNCGSYRISILQQPLSIPKRNVCTEDSLTAL